MTFLEAYRAWKAVTGKLPLSITILIEGEKKSARRSLRNFSRPTRPISRPMSRSSAIPIRWDRQTPAITTSLRGLVYEEIKIKAANRDLHSGLTGGAARNPSAYCHVSSPICTTTRAASRCLASMTALTDGVPAACWTVRNGPGSISTSKGVFGVDRVVDPGGEKDQLVNRAGVLATDLRRQRYRRWLIPAVPGAKTVDRGGSTPAKVSFPSMVGRQDPQKSAGRVPCICPRAHSGGLQRSSRAGMRVQR